MENNNFLTLRLKTYLKYDLHAINRITTIEEIN